MVAEGARSWGWQDPYFYPVRPYFDGLEQALSTGEQRNTRGPPPHRLWWQAFGIRGSAGRNLKISEKRSWP